ncbi:hypothetical protein FHX15_006361 [Rhizobium sp. BK650]|nr:hypothetical protein [Rhizobium sp. BK650]
MGIGPGERPDGRDTDVDPGVIAAEFVKPHNDTVATSRLSFRRIRYEMTEVAPPRS